MKPTEIRARIQAELDRAIEEAIIDEEEEKKALEELTKIYMWS